MAGDIGFPNSQSPSFLLRRPAGGDYARAGSLAGLEDAAAVLRYYAEVPEAVFESLLLAQPVDYDSVQVWWGSPPEGLINWTALCIVRSGFGHPSTPSDGEIAHYAKKPATGEQLPGSFIDTGLPSGRWFYYNLFFRIGVKWISAGQAHALVPVDYHHREHLLGLIPPFYLSREAEDSTSFLTRWMTIIGYDLDYTRTLAEGVQNIYDPDSAQQHLMEAMGTNNLGFRKPTGMGDIRYRSVLANNRTILWNRGTLLGLETYVEAVFKSEVSVSNGINELLLVDDAEFYSGVGNWCPAPWRIGYELACSRYGAGSIPPALALQPLNVLKTRNVKIESFVEYSDGRPDSPPVMSGPKAPWPLPSSVLSARGVARISAPAGEHLAITCGAGQKKIITGVDSGKHEMIWDEQHFDPVYRGIPVSVSTDVKDPVPTYYFSFWSRREPSVAGNLTENERDLIVYGFMQYDPEHATQGFSDGFRGVSAANPNNLGGIDGWQSRGTAVPPVEMTPRPTSLKMFRRSIKGGVGSNADEWEHIVGSFQLSRGTRFIVPFIWWQLEPVVAGDVPPPVPTPRYITGVMVSESQGVGADQVFLPDEFLKLLDQPTPDRSLIGGPGEDLPDRVLPPHNLPPYKILGEQ